MGLGLPVSCLLSLAVAASQYSTAGQLGSAALTASRGACQSAPCLFVAALPANALPVSLRCRSFEDAEAAAAPGGALAEGGSSSLTTAQRFSLQHRRDLLAGASTCLPLAVLDLSRNLFEIAAVCADDPAPRNGS